ncbi:hypothetical protein KCU81_g5807, partial [Aureobasidium melanogenum]
HSQLKTGHPVRSAIHKQLNGRLVLRWVTTWESLLLYVLRPLLSSTTQSVSSPIWLCSHQLLFMEADEHLFEFESRANCNVYSKSRYQG